MTIIGDLLERTCKNMIKTILFCLENATKGTVYRIGPIPALQAVRVTSGIRKEGNDEIQWGLPSSSDYNFPGKSWEQYKDRPDHVLEAMGWCVEKQLSWTADNPFEDVRSVGKQLRGEIEDFYHMEPVLVRKVDLYGPGFEPLHYPLDWRGNPIWTESEYIVAAVIKIHFLPHTLHRDDRSTKIIKELSRTLGTELLSLHLRETLSRAQKEFARHRLQSCKILAHELRNTLIKFGFIFSAINAVMGILREEWETQLRKALPHLESKGDLLNRLNTLLSNGLPRMGDLPELSRLGEDLKAIQDEMASRSLLPHQSEQWLQNRLCPKWEALLSATSAWDDEKTNILGLIERLRKTFRTGMDPDLIRSVNHLPKDLCERWSTIVYVSFTADKLWILEDILELLKHPALPVAHKEQIGKTLKSLKALVEVLPEVEERANRIILSLRYGSLSEMDAAIEMDDLLEINSPSPNKNENEVAFVD